MKYIRYGSVFLALAFIFLAGVLWYGGTFSKTVSVKNSTTTTPRETQENKDSDKRLAHNPLTGTMCEEGDARPFAVMLAADNVARPLYGIAQADIVVEMPALTSGITRYMGIFACEHAERSGPYDPRGTTSFLSQKASMRSMRIGAVHTLLLML